MTTTEPIDDVQPSRLVEAVRDHLAQPSDATRMAVVRHATYPLGRTDMPSEVAALEEVLRGVLDGEVDDHEQALNDVGWYDRLLRPTGRLRVVDDDWQTDTYDDDPALVGLSTERPPPPDPVDQDELDIAWQVRRYRINDEARKRYNAEKAGIDVPTFEDIAAVVRGEYEPLLPTMLTRDDGVSLMYPGLLHWLYGPDGCGKTMVAAYVTADLLRKGGTVVYFDWEGNRGLVGERVAEMGATADIVDKQLRYTRPGNLEPYTEWLAAGATSEWHLAIFDGTAKALAASGRDEDSNRDVLAWMEAVVTPLTANGCAVLMLDHVTKDAEGRAMPRGAGAKRNQVSGAAWEMRSGQPFNRRTAGYAKLIQRKDREGRTGVDGEVVAELHVQPSRRGTVFTLKPPTRSAVELARAVKMERVYLAVGQWQAANGEDPSTTNVWKIVGGNKGDVAELLDELADLGHLRCVRRGNGRPTTWEDVTPYRAPIAEPGPSAIAAQSEWDVLGGH